MKSNQLFLHQFPLFHQGKVRDTYTIPDHKGCSLVVATDRVSTHNIVHESLIPGKGICLTMLTAFFAEIFAREGIESHVLAYGKGVYDYVPELKKIDQGGGDYFARSLVAERLFMLPIEFVFRSFLTGSLWKLYESGGNNPYGLDLVSGLQRMSPLEVCRGQPLFTPTAKSESDEPLRTMDVVRDFPGAVGLASRAYRIVQEEYLRCGITVVDGKFEIGHCPRVGFVVADEFGTGDCCRLVPTEAIRLGGEPPWADKQIVRQAAEEMWGTEPRVPLVFPDEIIRRTIEAYRDMAERVTRLSVEKWERGYNSFPSLTY